MKSENTFVQFWIISVMFIEGYKSCLSEIGGTCIYMYILLPFHPLAYMQPYSNFPSKFE